MNERERKLAIVAGGVVLVLGLNWGFKSYRDTLETADRQVEKLTGEVTDKRDTIFAGDVAKRDLRKLVKKSLPNNPERAVAVYQQWLTQLLADDSGLTGVTVDKTRDVNVVNREGVKLYRLYAFKVTGTGSLPRVTSLLDRFYAREILHRISKLTVAPVQGKEGQFEVSMDVEAIALSDAPADQELPGENLPKDAPPSAAALAFLQQNLMSPPNQPPRFAGEARPRAVVGQPFEYTIRFDDPEKQRVKVELVGEAPEGVRFEEGRVTWLPREGGSVNLLVKAIDDGWPQKTTQQELTIEADVPPPPPEPPKFDESRTAVLTGLVRTGDAWQAWINLRTQNKTLRLGVGDPVKVGAVEGKIAEINELQAVILSNEKRLILRPGQSLAEAKPAG